MAPVPECVAEQECIIQPMGIPFGKVRQPLAVSLGGYRIAFTVRHTADYSFLMVFWHPDSKV